MERNRANNVLSGRAGGTAEAVCEPGQLSIRAALDRMRAHGVARVDGFAALYQWFIDKSRAGAPVRRARNVNPYLSGGEVRWAVEDSEGEHIPSDAIRLTNPANIKLLSQRGIHKPQGVPFAVTLICSQTGPYKDCSDLDLDNGTRVIVYRAQDKAAASKSSNNAIFNGSLRECYENGYPVGVYQPRSDGVHDVGLYFVTGVDAVRGEFTLQGPVESFADCRFERMELQDVLDGAASTDSPNEALIPPDERERVAAMRAARQGQAAFRESLLQAYGGACAVTGCEVPAALEAAHVWRHYGRASQTVAHGILLRADIHRIYDANLCAVDPGTMRLEFARELRSSSYQELYGEKVLRLPRRSDLWPNEREMELHFKEFRACEEEKRLFVG